VKGLTVAVVLWAALAPSLAAQAVRGVPPAGGISFQIPTPVPTTAPPSPVTPIRPAPPSPPPDLFRAAPGTYAPRFDGPVPAPVFPYAIGGYAAYPERVIERTVVLIPTSAFPAGAASPSAAGAATADKTADKPPVPGHKRPLYVIPNCYLGDSVPAADRLPKGCSSSQTRQITR
jgi:hypothetical protein